MGRRAAAIVLAAAVLATATAACRPGGGRAASGTAPTSPSSAEVASSSGPTAATAPAAAPVLLAAGDIASCASSGDEATAALVAAEPAAIVVTLGDNVYDRGTASELARCYDPSWGPSRARTRPVPGNHDYATAGAAGYFGYFGTSAGDPAKGYYSYDVGAWHVVALNSNCSIVSCAAGSAQEQWLRADLAAYPTACTLAYWHTPRFSSGTVHGSSTAVAPLWEALYDYDADVVLSGHEHNYERFAPLDPEGRLDDGRGIRSFVVGTGGASHYPLGPPITGSEVRNSDTFGVLQMTLEAGGFDWRFLPQAGKPFTDAGSAQCH